MPNRIEVPDELQSLIEKREGEDRRKEAEQAASEPKEDRRASEDRRNESEESTGERLADDLGRREA